MNEMLDLLPDTIKSKIDLGAVLVSVATCADVLPTVAAVLSISWSCIRIYEWGKAKLEQRRSPPAE